MSFVNGVNIKTGQGDTPMSIDMQTLNDTIIALITTVGIAVALSLAIVAAGALTRRGRAHSRTTGHAVAAPAQHPVQTDDARELVLR
jgi:ABC-type thiamine transport system ATPase subunit